MLLCVVLHTRDWKFKVLFNHNNKIGSRPSLGLLQKCFVDLYVCCWSSAVPHACPGKVCWVFCKLNSSSRSYSFLSSHRKLITLIRTQLPGLTSFPQKGPLTIVLGYSSNHGKASTQLPKHLESASWCPLSHRGCPHTWVISNWNYVYMCVQMYEPLCKEARKGYQLSCSPSLHFSPLRQALSLNLDLVMWAKLAGQWIVKVCLALSLGAGVLGRCAMPGFPHRCWWS